MSTAVMPQPTVSTRETVADLLRRLGDVPPERVLMHPTPGTATEADVLRRDNGLNMACELVDGTLVEKPMGYYESRLAAVLISILEEFVRRNDFGIVLGADATLRLSPGLVRLPDVSFVSWDHFPNRLLPAEPIPDLTPDLAVEVLSESNTKAEMARKRREYFTNGCRLVWEVDPDSRTVAVYTEPDAATVLNEDQTVDGGAVLPGFSLSIREWFTRAGQRRAK